MTVFLDGIAAQFYRGIGAEVQYIAPFSSVNFFIGANNSGKSIVLCLLAEQLAQAKSGKNIKPLEGPEVHRARETGQFLMAVGRRAETISNEITKENEAKHFQAQTYEYPQRTFGTEVRKICEKLTVNGQLWTLLKGHEPMQLHPSVAIQTAKKWDAEWQAVWSALTGQGRGGFDHWIPETLRVIAQKVMPALPNIFLVPAKRVLGKKDEAFDDLSGKGLIDHMASLQSPDYNRWKDDTDKFDRINRFLQEVTGKDGARLDVPHNREHILVHMDNKVLPLSSLGTGIHEVVLIAAFCTIHDHSIMCIEEPEIHLHPLLQRKLINYLIDNTSSQYFIATHSAAFFDAPGANIFHVTNDGEQTRIKAVVTKNGQRDILDDLGYHASDILQANAVIWVEGPSDRIYLNHWISAYDEKLHEGIHYTIMFYGGALIRHLTASDEALAEFIKLRDLNRNMAIVLDSDRDAETSALKPHAQRLVDDMGEGKGVAWVTAGREVENYVEGHKLQAALKQQHGRLYLDAGKTGPFDHAFYFWRTDPEKEGARKTYKDGDKVGVANIICQDEANLDILDLRERLAELTQMICKANGFKKA